jgi:hypothetical protein
MGMEIMAATAGLVGARTIGALEWAPIRDPKLPTTSYFSAFLPQRMFEVLHTVPDHLAPRGSRLTHELAMYAPVGRSHNYVPRCLRTCQDQATGTTPKLKHELPSLNEKLAHHNVDRLFHSAAGQRASPVCTPAYSLLCGA